MSFQYPLEAVKQTNRQKIAKISPKISKIHETPPNKQKTHTNFQKTSNHCQIHSKIKTKSSQNSTKKMKKNCFKISHVNRKFRSLRIFFSHLNFSLSRKQPYEQKPLFFRSTFHFSSAPNSLQNCWRVSFPASKITPIKLHKKRTSPILLFEL